VFQKITRVMPLLTSCAEFVGLNRMIVWRSADSTDAVALGFSLSTAHSHTDSSCE
jgi:hypothetical protein